MSNFKALLSLALTSKFTTVLFLTTADIGYTVTLQFKAVLFLTVCDIKLSSCTVVYCRHHGLQNDIKLHAVVVLMAVIYRVALNFKVCDCKL